MLAKVAITSSFHENFPPIIHLLPNIFFRCKNREKLEEVKSGELGGCCNNSYFESLIFEMVL